MINEIKQKFWDGALASNFKYGQFSDEFIKDLIDKKYILSPTLDYGCGRGELIKQLVANGIKTSGIDISEVGINQARVLLGQNACLMVGDYQDIKNKYKTITCKLVYAFVDDKNIFLHKVCEHIEDGGTFVVSTPVINESNKNTILKPGICASEQDCELLKKYFDRVELILNNVSEYGDNRVYVCFK